MATSLCAHCGAPLSRPEAAFCAACGQTQPDEAFAPTQRLEALTPGGEPALLLQDEGGATREIALGVEPLTIGRAPGNDLRLDARFVSARHARIDAEGQRHRIVDVGSTNGILFEGRRLRPETPLLLHDGDVLRIGDAATGNFISLSYRNPAAPRPARATAPEHFPLDPAVRQITIGRAGNTIVLDNPQVSRQHAVIEREGQGHALRDLESSNGTFVNGRRIARHPLTPGDVIQIGPFRLIYDGAALARFDQRGAVRLEARNLWRAVEQDGVARLILKDISLAIAPREFVALVGGSGAGKSTLLNALAGFEPAGSGRVLLNGDDLYANFDAYRSLIGYVPQEETLHRALPAERALGYAAELRLPDDTAPEEIERRIDAVLADVEMAAARTTPVERLSGGQRKRVGIGAELLADPSLFFLDEPTSGLDPGLEKKLMYTLRRLADSGRTIVLVTHATANIAQCDHVAFVADGRLVYFGPPAGAPAFFAVGSGDLADIYTKLDGHADQHDPERWAIVQRDLRREYDAWAASRRREPPTLAELWEMKFRRSPEYERYIQRRLAGRATNPETGSEARPPRPPRVSLVRQFAILTRRYADLMARDGRNLALLLLQAPVIGLLLLLVARPDAIAGAEPYASEAKKVLFMLATVAVWFGIINAAREIAKETPIYRRERLANLHIGPYLLSKIAVLLLLVVAQSTTLIGLLALGVQLPAFGPLLPAWIELLITTILTAAAGLAAGLALSAFAATPDRATSLVPLALIPQILFAGVIFDLGDGLTPQRALSWFTISRWTIDAYGTTVNLNDLPPQPGLLRLPNAAAEYAFSAGHLLRCWGLLLLYTLACLLLAAWLLRRRERLA